MALALATAACGAQEWSFDADGAAASGADADIRQEAAALDGSPRPTEAAVDGAAEAESRPDAPSGSDASATCSIDGDCSSDAPLCRQPAGACVRCGADDECANAAAGPACDTSTGRCVLCVSDLQCSTTALPRCDRSTHSCVRCLSSADCGRDAFCDLAAHACRPMI